MNTKIKIGIKIEIKIERGTIISLKIIFFFFKRCNISMDIIENSIIIIFSASEISALKIDLIYY